MLAFLSFLLFHCASSVSIMPGGIVGDQAHDGRARFSCLLGLGVNKFTGEKGGAACMIAALGRCRARRNKGERIAFLIK